VTVRFGFLEVPNIPKVLHIVKAQCPLDLDDAIYFSERDRVVRRKTKPRFAGWRRRVFAFLYRNSIHPADRFNFPAGNFVQVARQREI
jgi:KUP system potassium uptake protein